jgi:hypothetical protein
MDAATLEQDVNAELKHSNALCDDAVANIFGVWAKAPAASPFGAEHSSTPAKANPGEGRYVSYA